VSCQKNSDGNTKYFSSILASGSANERATFWVSIFLRMDKAGGSFRLLGKMREAETEEMKIVNTQNRPVSEQAERAIQEMVDGIKEAGL
jgi:hypothetical protein